MNAKVNFFIITGIALSCVLTLTGCIGPDNEDRNAQAVVEPTAPSTNLHQPTGAVENLSIDMLVGRTFRALNRNSENLESLDTPAGELLTLEFTQDADGTVFVNPSSGCNFMGSPATVTTEGTLEAHEMMTTDMLCEGWRGDAETWLSSLVQDSPHISYINQGDHYTLVLQTATKFMEFLEEAPLEFAQVNAWAADPNPDSEVDSGTDWTVNVDDQGCLIFENPENARVLPVFQDSRTARTLGQHLGETLSFTGEGPFDNLDALKAVLAERMPTVDPNSSETLRVPQSCPTDIPVWVVGGQN